jgi:hypothetical protein
MRDYQGVELERGYGLRYDDLYPFVTTVLLLDDAVVPNPLITLVGMQYCLFAHAVVPPLPFPEQVGLN